MTNYWQAPTNRNDQAFFMKDRRLRDEESSLLASLINDWWKSVPTTRRLVVADLGSRKVDLAIRNHLDAHDVTWLLADQVPPSSDQQPDALFMGMKIEGEASVAAEVAPVLDAAFALSTTVVVIVRRLLACLTAEEACAVVECVSAELGRYCLSRGGPHAGLLLISDIDHAARRRLQYISPELPSAPDHNVESGVGPWPDFSQFQVRRIATGYVYLTRVLWPQLSGGCMLRFEPPEEREAVLSFFTIPSPQQTEALQKYNPYCVWSRRFD